VNISEKLVRLRHPSVPANGRLSSPCIIVGRDFLFMLFKAGVRAPDRAGEAGASALWPGERILLAESDGCVRLNGNPSGHLVKWT
jgi:hypothetical protein